MENTPCITMDIERRVLYNSLRMNWIQDPSITVEPWQVEDYRALPLDAIFERLRLQDLYFDKNTFAAAAEQFDNPEELTDDLLANYDVDVTTHDQVYLLFFELWRRLLPEKSCLSIFCDELDHRIFLYDQDQIGNQEPLQDAIAILEVILDENSDEGHDPVSVFQSVCAGCANDIESFLYDFMSDQIEQHNTSYAAELLDGFMDYVSDVKWFEFLRARQLSFTDPEGAFTLVKQILIDTASEPDLDFNLEVLSFMVEVGSKEDFNHLVRSTIPLLTLEEEFQDLLTICEDFYHRLDRETAEKAIISLLKTREKIPLSQPLGKKDSGVAELVSILNLV